METKRRSFSHAQDALKLLLALWLIVSPWVLNYSQVRLPVWNGYAVAIIVAAFSIAAMLKFTKWEEWVNIVVGFWLFASPWVLGYDKLLENKVTLPTMFNHIFVGVAIVMLSLYELNLWERATGGAHHDHKENESPTALSRLRLGKREEDGQVVTASKIIAALIGPTLIASAASIFLNLDAWPAMVEQAFHNPALVFATGYPLFVAGLAIVYFHNHWTGGWRVVVTVLGWLTIASGLSRILFPARLADIAAGAVQHPSVMPIAALIILVIGVFLSFKAYSRE